MTEGGSQNTILQNNAPDWLKPYLSQLFGPSRPQQSMSERLGASALGQQIAHPLRFIAGFGEHNIGNQLANAMLNPQMAGGLLGMRSNPALASALWAQQGLLGATAAGPEDSLMTPSKEAIAPRNMDLVSPRQAQIRPSLQQQLVRNRGY